jgi:hypothetical protein
MTKTGDPFCGDGEGRGERLVAYLYDDLDAGERARIESHLSGCPACRDELAALGGVRAELARWAPPEPSGARSPEPGVRSPRSRLAMFMDIPAWAQTAAALLCVGVAAGLANLDVRYGAEGLQVRTGWSSAPAPVAASAPIAAPAPATTASPWQADLAALEEGLRAELVGSRALAPSDPMASPQRADGAPLTNVRTLIEESEERQRRELALRLADLLQDVEYQRRDDLEKIDRSLGLIQANLGIMQNTGVEVLRQRQMINDLAVRVSQR